MYDLRKVDTYYFRYIIKYRANLLKYLTLIFEYIYVENRE
jgi:hypothetical protein